MRRFTRLTACVFSLGWAALLSIRAATPACDLSDYKASPGLTAANTTNGLVLAWQGDGGSELRMRTTIVDGTPTIAELSVKKGGRGWARSEERRVGKECRL